MVQDGRPISPEEVAGFEQCVLAEDGIITEEEQRTAQVILKDDPRFKDLDSKKNLFIFKEYSDLQRIQALTDPSVKTLERYKKALKRIDPSLKPRSSDTQIAYVTKYGLSYDHIKITHVEFLGEAHPIRITFEVAGKSYTWTCGDLRDFNQLNTSKYPVSPSELFAALGNYRGRYGSAQNRDSINIVDRIQMKMSSYYYNQRLSLSVDDMLKEAGPDQNNHVGTHEEHIHEEIIKAAYEGKPAKYEDGSKVEFRNPKWNKLITGTVPNQDIKHAIEVALGVLPEPAFIKNSPFIINPVAEIS